MLSFSFSVSSRTTLAGEPRIIEPSGRVHLARDKSARADDAVVADDSAVEHRRAHADDHAVADGRAVDGGAVADGHIVADGDLVVDQGEVLNVARLPMRTLCISPRQTLLYQNAVPSPGDDVAEHLRSPP